MYNKNNYGFNLKLEKEHIRDSDWIFGAFSEQCIANIPEDDRIDYLPKGEVQRGLEDTMDCATRGPLNILETKFNWLYKNNKFYSSNLKWLEDNQYIKDGYIEFSDAYIAILSGTTREGNSMKAPLQAIENYGLIPKHKLPLLPNMTFNEYHNKDRITEELKILGGEFKKRFNINYERVNKIHYNELYKEDMLVQAGFAWPQPVDGEYKNTSNEPNHVWVGICRPLHIIFDNYIDNSDGDFIKKLSSDYSMIDYGYRLYITQNLLNETEELKEKKVIHTFQNDNITDIIYVLFKKLYGILKRIIR